MPATKTFYSDFFKIPLAGPAPYNTLVVVNQWFSANQADHYEGQEDYFHYNVQVLTDYSPSGYDPNSLTPVDFQHSTTFAFINTIASNNSHFFYAVDQITDAGFDPPTGAFYVSVDTVVQLADMVNPQGTEIFLGWENDVAFLMTSFIMVNEPKPDATLQTDSGNTRHRWFSRIKNPNEVLLTRGPKPGIRRRLAPSPKTESIRNRMRRLDIDPTLHRPDQPKG